MASANVIDAHIDAWAKAFEVSRDKIRCQTNIRVGNALPDEVPINIAFLSLTSTNKSTIELAARQSEMTTYATSIARGLKASIYLNELSDVDNLEGMKMKTGNFLDKVAKKAAKIEIIYDGHGTKDGKLGLTKEGVNMNDFAKYVSEFVYNYEADGTSSFPDVLIIFAQCYANVSPPSIDGIHSKVHLITLATSETPVTTSCVRSNHIELDEYAKSREPGQGKEEMATQSSSHGTNMSTPVSPAGNAAIAKAHGSKNDYGHNINQTNTVKPSQRHGTGKQEINTPAQRSSMYSRHGRQW